MEIICKGSFAFPPEEQGQHDDRQGQQGKDDARLDNFFSRSPRILRSSVMRYSFRSWFPQCLRTLARSAEYPFSPRPVPEHLFPVTVPIRVMPLLLLSFCLGRVGSIQHITR